MMKEKFWQYHRLQSEQWEHICLALYIVTQAHWRKTGSALLLGGGIGNLVDRIKNKNVTDFIYVDFKKAPIFNVADIAALFGGILVVFKAMIDEI